MEWSPSSGVVYREYITREGILSRDMRREGSDTGVALTSE